MLTVEVMCGREVGKCMTDRDRNCLMCTLPICNEADRQCLFNRTDYFQTYYQIHRDRKNEAAKSRYHELKQNPEWRKQRNERERQRRKYASTNLSICTGDR